MEDRYLKKKKGGIEVINDENIIIKETITQDELNNAFETLEKQQILGKQVYDAYLQTLKVQLDPVIVSSVLCVEFMEIVIDIVTNMQKMNEMYGLDSLYCLHKLRFVLYDNGTQFTKLVSDVARSYYISHLKYCT